MSRAFSSLLLEFLLPLVVTSTVMDYYTEIQRCSSNVPLTTVFQSFPVMSQISCAVACSATSTCKTFSMSTDGTRTCSLHTESPTVLTCPAAERHFQKLTGAPCLNKGVYDNSTDTCQCFDGYIGSRCEKIMQDCTEGHSVGAYSATQAVYWIFPRLAPTPFRAQCWMFIGKTVMQYQKFGNVSFARTWAEYKSGFGHLLGDHWLGLDHVFYITNSRPQHLAFLVITRTFSGTAARYHYYSHFKVSDESNQYRFNFSAEWSQNGMGDCLTNLKNAPFSTIDVNNADTCASDFNAGWWFTTGTCSACNPNGLLRKDLVYWSHNVTHTHWASITGNFGITYMVMILTA